MKDDKLLNIDSLMNFGFIECGSWTLNDGGLKPNFFCKAVGKVIYAFATKTKPCCMCSQPSWGKKCFHASSVLKNIDFTKKYPTIIKVLAGVTHWGI